MKSTKLSVRNTTHALWSIRKRNNSWTMKSTEFLRARVNTIPSYFSLSKVCLSWNQVVSPLLQDKSTMNWSRLNKGKCRLSRKELSSECMTINGSYSSSINYSFWGSTRRKSFRRLIVFSITKLNWRLFVAWYAFSKFWNFWLRCLKKKW